MKEFGGSLLGLNAVCCDVTAILLSAHHKPPKTDIKERDK